MNKKITSHKKISQRKEKKIIHAKITKKEEPHKFLTQKFEKLLGDQYKKVTLARNHPAYHFNSAQDSKFLVGTAVHKTTRERKNLYITIEARMSRGKVIKTQLIPQIN